ncbi:MAG: xanthine dehydrogenase accessory protein XdhC [Oscillospiraceae bacterium]|nr:xanthine dehydrogenase accessory protein XdhC [Oscillospiraceae bacterium]
MKAITQAMIERIRRGERVVLCTILASSGSAPRGAGARMAVFADGTTMGTVGGGQVEFLAAKEALGVIETGTTAIRSFDLAPAQVASIGMVCGGKVTIYYQLLSEEELPVLLAMEEALRTDENAWIYLKIREGSVEEFRVVSGEEALIDPEHYCAKAILVKGEPLEYFEPLMRAGRVYIFGGGHVGQALVPVLAGVDFRVTVYDKRKELATRDHFPQAEEVIYGDYEHIFEKVTLKPSDYVVIMTPGHESDYALLEQVLRKETTYVGCIGSRHKIARTQELLRQAGISEERIKSVHSPIGLPIGAQTPAEIAICIAAEMILHRSQNP